MSGISSPYRFQYEHVAAGQTAQVLGGTGAVGDYLHRLVCTVTIAATGNVVIGDGAFSHTILPALQGHGIGVYDVEINAASASGAWKITTGAGVEVMAVGIFSA
jgi:hypothetical protein